jgi:pilus assembly protein CpaF
LAGFIISILGGKGGVGKSVVAANLAFAFAAETKQKALLLDFDQSACGDLDLITGMKSKKSLLELSEFNGAIDPRTIETFLATPLQNVSYISMPKEPTKAESIMPENVGKALKAFKNLYPITIIDVGHTLNPLALKALEASTLIFVVVTPDVLAVNQSRRLYNDLLTLLFPKQMIQIICNQFQSGHPVTPEVIGNQMGKAAFAAIPKDDQSCIFSLNKSRPALLLNKTSGFSKGITEVVRQVIQKNVLKSLEALNKPSGTLEVKNKDSEVSFKKGEDPWTLLKLRIHKGLHEAMDLKDDGKDDDPGALKILREQCKRVIVELLNKEETKSIVKSREDMNRVVKEILDEAVGLGPLEDLLSDKTISEIMVNGPFTIFYEKSGKIKKSDITFTNDRQVRNVISKIIAPIGRRIDEKTPYVDARLQDGSRVHAIIKPCALDGSTITIRKFPEKVLSYKDLISFGSLNQNMADFLRLSVEAKRNIVVAGGTGSGKTALVNILSSFIPANERIITVEDSAELTLPQEHVVRLETKPPSLEGEGEVDIRTLVRQTLRMRPDRIVVGECRGGEALDMLQAMNTGHEGSLTTVHANTPRDCISRLETLVQYAGTGLGPKAIKEMVASAVHMIIVANRLDDGSRKIVAITEVAGMQGDVVTLQPIFEFKQEGVDKRGKIIGKFMASGFIPKFVEVLERKGYKIPRGIFNNAA